MPKINTINDFADAVHTALATEFPECKIEAVNVTKNNNVHLTGMTIKPQNKKVAPAIYLEPYFNMLQSGQTLETIIDQIISSCTDALSCAENGIDAEAITDFKQVKGRICYKLINRDKNSELLRAAPHRDYHDLAVVYYIQLSKTDNGLATVTITDSLARNWGVDEETLYGLAEINTPKINRGCVTPITDILSGLSGSEKDAACKSGTYGSFNFTSVGNGELEMYVATNQNKTYGAASILYGGLLDAVARNLGSFYILPSSVHELIIIPQTFGNPEELKQMVKDINGSEVPEEEILSENCYCYDAGTQEFKIAV